MDLLGTIIVGFVVGVVAKILMPGKGPSGFVLTTVLGIAGAWVGRWLLVDILELTTQVGFIGSVIGAMALLLAHRVLTRG
ncbi:MAG: putative membrane protein YeaQ/YmgE (transglycosylase-associated protein family) [Glaciecola sp.]|jgi:uncharacterized membrane protein YeaQ/YmgE (transglycosylase-associated protein family)